MVITYRLVTPSGRTLTGKVSKGVYWEEGAGLEMLPMPGTPVLVQYAMGLHRPL